jgi:uncharacterized protein YidB (DUF937 family)
MGWNYDRDDGDASSAYSARDGTDRNRYGDAGGEAGRARVDRTIHPGRRAPTDRMSAPPADVAAEPASDLRAALGVADVPVHTGEEARTRTEAHGARGLADASNVYVHPEAGNPAEVTAHEAIHQAQARLPASQDAGRDAAEHEAAELAGEYARSGAVRAPRFAIDLAQRPAPDVDAKGARPGVTAALYVQSHGAQVVAGIRNHLARAPWIAPHARVTLASVDRFVDATVDALAAQLGAPLIQPTALLEVVYPANPWQAVDASRSMLGVDKAGAASHAGDPLWDGPLGVREWTESVASAIAIQVETALRGSLARMAPRFASAVDRSKEGAPAGASVAPPIHTDLVTSHPMDRVVARALTAPGAASVTGEPRKGARAEASGSPAAVRPVVYAWQGGCDPTLWNWLKVIEPADATAEELAETLWGDGQGEAVTFYAYGITAAPPYFGLPPAWARQFADAQAHEPKDAGAAGPEDAQHRLVALAGSTVADELALAQASDGPRAPAARGAVAPTATPLLATLDTSTIQAEYVARALGPWDLGDAPRAALLFLERRREALATATPDDVTRWAPVIDGQQAILLVVATAIGELSHQLADVAPSDPQAAPFRDVLTTYARAAATSHLVDTSRALVAGAQRQQQLLVSQLVQARVRASGVAVGDLDTVTAGSLTGEWEQQRGLEQRAASMHSQLLLGQAPSAEDVDEVTLAADELHLRSQLRSLSLRLDELGRLAGASTESLTSVGVDVATGGEVMGLSDGAYTLRLRVGLVEDALDVTNKAQNAALDRRMSEDERRAVRRRQRHAALAEARQRYAAISEESNIAEFLRHGHETIRDHQRRARVAEVLVSIAVLVGVSYLSAGLGNIVTGWMRGAMLARGAQAAGQVTRLSRLEMAGSAVTGMAVESSVNALAQSQVAGTDLSEAFGEDFLANLASRAVLRPFQTIIGDIDAIDRSAVTGWTRLRHGQVVLAKTAVLTAETVTSMAVGYVAHRLVSDKTPDPATVEDWLIQGASLAVGRFVHAQLGEQSHRVEQLAAIHGFEQGLALRRDVTRLRTQAHAAQDATDGIKALNLLASRHELLVREQALLDQLAANPAAMADAGIAARDVVRLRDEVTEQQGETASHAFGALQLRLAGLSETVPGAVWTGSEAQVQLIRNEGGRAGLRFVEQEPGLRWTVTLGDRTVEVHVRKEPVPATGRDGEFKPKPPPTREGALVLAGHDWRLHDAAMRIEPVPGALDMIVHGNVDTFDVFLDGKYVELDHRRLAAYIEKAGLEFDYIRLVACESGVSPKGAAQHLANKMDVLVKAPNNIAHQSEGTPGGIAVGPTHHRPDGTVVTRDTGEWVWFGPNKKATRRWSRTEGPKPSERAEDRYKRKKATEKLSAIPVWSRRSAEGASRRDAYYVSKADAVRMGELLALFPDVTVIHFDTGLLVRRFAEEWYFDIDEPRLTTDGSEVARSGEMGTDARGRSLAPHAGYEVGLPVANAATIELWGFRGVRTIQGRPEAEWTSAERAQVAAARRETPLLYAGHVGVSFDGGRTIMGFTPDVPDDMPMEAALESLKAHEAYPGIVGNDTDVFRLATDRAQKDGWDTKPIRAIQLVDRASKAKLANQVDAMRTVAPGEHGLGYSFPLRDPVDGQHYADSNGFCAANVANCAAFPARIGIATPEPSGNAKAYLAALANWISDKAPVDERSVDIHSEEGD